MHLICIIVWIPFHTNLITLHISSPVTSLTPQEKEIALAKTVLNNSHRLLSQNYKTCIIVIKSFLII